jgi:DNA-binding HxlR family transcriptional regulator
MSPVLPLPVTTASRESCTATDVLRLVGEKWTVLVLVILRDGGPSGFNRLDRTVEGLSRRILTRTLRNLEENGLISRRVTTSHVEYAITGLGASLLPLILAVGEWAVEHAPEMASARAAYLSGLR